MADLLRAPGLNVPHGFSTREGADAGDILPGSALVTVRQVHSPDVAIATAPWAESERPAADAIVTDRPGLALAIVTADCAPVLLADEGAGVIGAAHAGWRGAQSGVIANTLAAMEALGARAERIVAAIGPCIAQANYEVDDAMRAHFPDEDARFFAPAGAGHYRFDLPGFVGARLRDAGVGAVVDLARDTYAEEDRFFSYRRATHRGEPTGGRQISLIALRQTA